MVVRIETIREICKNILDKTEEITPIDIELNYTTYWSVPFDDGQKLSPSDPIVNDLRDDWSCLKGVLDTRKDPKQLDFEHLGNIFKAIGLRLERIKEKKRKA